ncbi:MAG: hypothetical protein ACKOXR_05830 [Bacteroidota bacterium]
MESNNSSLRAVLNNIASIQHELANRQTQLLDSDILMQLKGLAAQLYLESDIELLSLSDEEHFAEPVAPAPVVEVGPVVEVAPVAEAVPVVEVPPVVEVAPVVPIVEVAPVLEEIPVVESIQVATPEVVPAFIPEVEQVALSVVEVAPVVEATPVVEVAPVVEVVPVVEVPPVVEVATVVEATPVVESLNGGEKSGKTVDEVISAMPLSRRFEFANILFGGDMQKMGMFIQQFIDAPNAAGRLDVYDQWYEEKQWRRRDESASDMLRMLKRMFAS